MSLAEPLQQIDRTFVLHRGQKLSYFGGCDYFRLSSHPDVLRALSEGTRKFGLNVAASRTTTGNHELFGKLESELARFFGADDAILLSNGYATNLAFAQSFSSHFTHAFIDERSHSSLLDASALLDQRAVKFRHRDAEQLRKRLGRLRRATPLVLTDGLFAHDGSVAPLTEYLAALPRDGMLLVDDAHGGGTIGRTGQGTPEVCGVRDPRLVQTISLSKAFGVYGGAVLGSERVIGTLRERSRIFQGNTPPPLPLVNAALTSLKILKTDRYLRTRLNANAAHLKNALRSAGWPLAENTSPIVAIVPESTSQAEGLRRRLLRAKVFPSLIRYGHTPAPGYFRFVISSEHTRAQLDALAAAVDVPASR
jgi:8-amino-7-oxononanoate synthase